MYTLSVIMWYAVHSATQCQPRRDQSGQPCVTALHTCNWWSHRSVHQWYVKPHHVHIGSLLAYFFVNYVLHGTPLTCISFMFMPTENWKMNPNHYSVLYTYSYHIHSNKSFKSRRNGESIFQKRHCIKRMEFNPNTFPNSQAFHVLPVLCINC